MTSMEDGWALNTLVMGPAAVTLVTGGGSAKSGDAERCTSAVTVIAVGAGAGAGGASLVAA